MSASGGSNINHGHPRGGYGESKRSSNREQVHPRNRGNEGVRSQGDANGVSHDRNRGSNTVLGRGTASVTHSSRHFPPVAVHKSYHLSRNDAHGIAAASPASRRERQERSHPIQYRDFQNGSGPAGGHGHSDSNHQGVGASAGISHPDRRMTKVTARIPPHDESQNSESFGRENSNVSSIQHGFHGSSSEQWRRRKNHMCRYTPSAARRQEQRRTKQEQYAESQKLKSECMECKTKDDTIQKLRIDTSTVTASWEDENFQQKKSIKTQEQPQKTGG